MTRQRACADRQAGVKGEGRVQFPTVTRIETLGRSEHTTDHQGLRSLLYKIGCLLALADDLLEKPVLNGLPKNLQSEGK